jgi:hypothetical protein
VVEPRIRLRTPDFPDRQGVARNVWWADEALETPVKDGAAKIVEIKVECPKCGQESAVRVATGHDIEALRKSIVCVFCQNPWVEYLPGQVIGEPFERRSKGEES